MKQIRFDGKFRLFLPLEAQSPMIHFQARGTGATVRATEVKPKFDRFLWKRIGDSGVNSAGMIQKQSENDKRDANPSLNTVCGFTARKRRRLSPLAMEA